jgi:protein-tyrosine phosphatase
MHERDVLLEGMVNVRDLGGFRTKTGQTTRYNVFLRGDAPYRISDSARHRVVEQGLHTVIDMRYAHEVAQRPNRFAGYPDVDFHHIPLYVETTYLGMIRQFRDLGGWYCTILDQGGTPIRNILGVLSRAEGVCLLQCYLGKDRTGILSALLLNVVGVSEADIIADYLQSQENLRVIHEEIQSVRPFFVTKPQFENIISAKREYITALLAHLSQKYSDAEGYMRAIGVLEEDIAILRQKLIVPECRL